MDLRVLRYFTAVAEELHIGRAAARLRMTQPPLSRAMRRLEDDLGVLLLRRTRTGVALTPAGETLLAEATALLEHADRVRDRVRVEAGDASLVVGSLADSADLVGGRLVAAFRERHPHVTVRVHEFDLGDPTAGLRAGRVDVALTREPFDASGLRTYVLATQPVGVVVRGDDDLAGRAAVAVASLAGRPWVRLPGGTDEAWTRYWTGLDGDGDDERTPVRTIQECLQSVLWNGMLALAPLDQVLPPGLVTVPVTDRPPSRLVLAWRGDDGSPLIRAFVQGAADSFPRRGRPAPDAAPERG